MPNSQLPSPFTFSQSSLRDYNDNDIATLTILPNLVEGSVFLQKEMRVQGEKNEIVQNVVVEKD